MNNLFKLLLILILVGVTKAVHKLLLLAAIGLAALVMLHVLAQDYNRGQQRPPTKKSLFKRSSSYCSEHICAEQMLAVDWDEILSKDYVGCARSFICQLVAKPQEQLQKEEEDILAVIRHSMKVVKNLNAGVKSTIKEGELNLEPHYCQRIYKYCPYTNDMMLKYLSLLPT